MDSPMTQLTAESLWDLETLFAAPNFRWLETEKPIRALIYEGLPYAGHIAEVFAWYASPLTIGVAQEIPAGGFPAVVLIHGGGGTAFSTWVHLWAQRGYAAIAMDLGAMRPADPEYDPVTGAFIKDVATDTEKRTPLGNGGPDQTAANKFASIDREPEHHWTRHAVANTILAHSLIRSFAEVDAEHTAVTGISWGGYTTCIAASVDHRFKAAAPIYGCGFLHTGESNQKPEIYKLPQPSRAKWIALYDPSSHLPRCRVPIFFVNGTHDPHYPLDSYARTIALPQGPVITRIEPHMLHSHEHGWAPMEIGIFIDTHCRPGSVPLPHLEQPEVGTDEIKVRYTSTVPPKCAALHFTAEKGLRADRNWLSVAAVIESVFIVAPPLPAGTNTWFITLTDERGAMVSTAPMVSPPLRPEEN